MDPQTELGFCTSQFEKSFNDIAKCKSEGYSSVFIRVGYTPQGKFIKDTTFDELYKEARRHKLKVGAYLYIFSIDETLEKNVSEFIGSLYRKKLELPAAICYENNEHEKIDAYKAFIIERALRHIQNAGYSPMLSTYKYLLGKIQEISPMNNVSVQLLEKDVDNLQSYNNIPNIHSVYAVMHSPRPTVYIL